ncbi:MAG: hypothetical protein Q9225_002566 [Loekoesia sp. 1 TL-2023]
MASGTRNQAKMQGLNELDQVSLDAPTEQIEGALGREEARQEFDKLSGCYPVFCLTANIPNQYMAEVVACKNPDDYLVEMTSNDPDPSVMLGQCKLNQLDDGAVKPMPFVGWTVKACYDFFCTRLLPIPSVGRSYKFTDFTFLAIDADCVSAIPPEIIVGSDAADYGEEPEDPPKLKVIRQPIIEIMEALAALEVQTSTPSEVANRTKMVASIMPPPIVAAISKNGLNLPGYELHIPIPPGLLGLPLRWQEHQDSEWWVNLLILEERK